MSGVPWADCSPCPYCGRQLPASHLQSHLQHCDLALEKCPSSCGASIQRRYKSLHLKSECPLRPPSAQRAPPVEASGAGELNKLRSALDEERRLRGIAVSELRQRCDALDAWNKKLVTVLTALKESVVQRAAGDSSQQVVRVAADLSELREDLSKEQAARLRSEGEYDEQLARLSSAVSAARDQHSELEERYTELVSTCERLTLDLEEMVHTQQEEATTWRAEVRGLRRREAERSEGILQEIGNVQKRIEEDNVALSGVWGDMEIRLGRMETKMAAMSVKLADMDQQLVKQQDLRHAVQVPGHLLWKISDFEQKMAEAKELDTSLHSPIFFSSQFGYKLRLQVHLNGVGHWKGRNIIIGLQVLPGDWDPLLPQPFNRKVTLVLKDQAPPEKANDLQKILKAGTSKEDPAGFHQFIPHKTLKEHNYIKDNVIFLEVIVN